MSVLDCVQPICQRSGKMAIEHVIESKEKDLGGFSVRRVLPASEHKRVGPFIFFDHFGPATFAAGTGIDVRPHPHIGLSALTYLFEGQLVHRDSLGFVQTIEPGAVNWMTGGRGIVHSERSPAKLRASGFSMHGIQSWVALPDGYEEVEPTFTHYEAHTLPVIQRSNASLTLVAGEAYGERSPVGAYSPLFYVHGEAQSGADIPLPGDYAERAVYVVSGEIAFAGRRYTRHRMIVMTGEAETSITAVTPCRVMLLGGAALESDRTVWWNFSSSSKARLEAAKRDWREGRFDPVPGETEFIPLPDE